MGINSADVEIPKVVLSILGYLTESSIATLKSKKSVQNLENEFLKHKNTSTMIDKHYEKYPFLRDIICFPSGLQVILLQIASFVSRCHENIERNTVDKVLNASKCKDLTAANILLSENGLSCKVICPQCKKEKALSPSFGETGTISFSIHNFDRHYEKCKAAVKSQLNSTLNESVGSNASETMIDHMTGIK